MIAEGSQVTKQQSQGGQHHTSTHRQYTANQAMIAPGSTFAQARHLCSRAYRHTKTQVHIIQDETGNQCEDSKARCGRTVRGTGVPHPAAQREG